MKRWIDPLSVTVSDDVLAVVEGDVLLANTLVRRGITESQSVRRFLFPDQYTPASPYDLPDMELAVERVEAAIAQGESICVWGDFDVDGQTATALLVSAFAALGAQVLFYIPQRLTEGHGLNLPKLESLLTQGVQLLVTCDTGIAAHEAVAYANSRGVDVIITDHHQLPPALPDVHAVLNPQRLSESHPLHTLPGVGCAFKLVEALYDRAGRSGLSGFLDLVAMGIVADVAIQTGDTRFLLQQGLQVLRETQRSGLVAMAELARFETLHATEETIGFSIAPRLNALGRLDDANVAVEFLTTQDQERARILASQLEGLNAQRKTLSEQVFQAALEQINNDGRLLDHAVLVLGHERWPGGIIGIVANRLVEEYNRPVILLNVTAGEMARGSARSVPGVDITAAIAAHADLLDHFGGHTMAAGLSLHSERIPEFRRAISKTVAALSSQVDTVPTLAIDSYLRLDEISLDLLHRLDYLSPFGPGNPALTFATRKLTLKNHRQIGRSGEHVRLTVADDDGTVQDVVWWRADLDMLPPGRFDLAYALKINDFQGQRTVQLEFLDARAVDEEPQEFGHRADVEVIDYRDLSLDDQLVIAQELAKEAMVWNEGHATPDLVGFRRDQLRPSPELAIWTTPPGPTELRAALEIVNPGKVYLCAVESPNDTMKEFTRHLAGLVKHVVNARDGNSTLAEVAAAMGHREITVRNGLELLAKRGDVRVDFDEDAVRISYGGEAQGDSEAIARRLDALLKETAAYREYYRQADATALIQV